MAQKVDVSYQFLRKFIFHLEDKQYGKELMIICLNVGLEIVEKDTHDLLTVKITEYKEDRDMSYILTELQQYVKDNIKKLKVNDDMLEVSGRVTRQSSATEFSDYIKIAKFNILSYINKLWVNIDSRLEYTDTSFCSSFSEAPAESVFSIYENVISGRETLSVKRATSLVRLFMEGPGVATTASLDLSKRSLKRHSSESHLGERFCGKRWIPGVTSKTVMDIQNK